jgi:hypothetical protein
MKVRRLLVSAMCLTLPAALGCGPRHAPVSITVVVPSQAEAPPQVEASSLLAEKGATLTFEAARESPPDTLLEVRFLRNGVATQVCREGITLTGPSPLTCHAIATGDFEVAITEIHEGKRHPRPHMMAYIRPCKGCSTE